MILNLTQHPGIPEQGVFDLTGDDLARLKTLLTFEELPVTSEVEARADEIAVLATRLPVDQAMIGGAPFLMAPLERALEKVGIKPLYAFSRREVVEEVLTDGNVRKTAIFRHLGFV